MDEGEDIDVDVRLTIIKSLATYTIIGQISTIKVAM